MKTIRATPKAPLAGLLRAFCHGDVDLQSIQSFPLRSTKPCALTQTPLTLSHTKHLGWTSGETTVRLHTRLLTHTHTHTHTRVVRHTVRRGTSILSNTHKDGVNWWRKE